MLVLFNMISADRDTSTNDSFLYWLMGWQVILRLEKKIRPRIYFAKLNMVTSLSKMIAADGEGPQSCLK